VKVKTTTRTVSVVQKFIDIHFSSFVLQ